MGYRFVAVAALALIAVRAEAQPVAAPSPQAPSDRTCTTTTTVVKRGDVVLSTTSATKCEDEPGTGGGGLNPGAVLAGPGELLKSLTLGGGVKLTPKNARGDWHALEPGSIRVCHIFLTSQPTKTGLRVRTSDCRGPLAGVANWRFEDDAAALLGMDGSLVVKMRGDRDALQGEIQAGPVVILQR